MAEMRKVMRTHGKQHSSRSEVITVRGIRHWPVGTHMHKKKKMKMKMKKKKEEEEEEEEKREKEKANWEIIS